MKYKVEDTLIVYNDAPTYIDGDLVKVIERDTIDGSYYVASLADIYDVQGDVSKLMERSCKWVKEEDTALVSYKRPTSLSYRISRIIRRLFSKDFRYKVSVFIRRMQFWRKIDD